jgi:tryptophanyl-tRNA synthetase
LRQAYAQGISWSDAKQLLFERIDREIAPMRERHDALIRNPAELEKVLSAGAAKARAIATPFMAELRSAVGLRNLAAGAGKTAKPRAAKIALPSFKQYRETDGRHYFKLVDAAGRLLAQSAAFATPQDAGREIAQLKREGSAGVHGALQPAEGVDPADVTAALQLLARAQER